MLTKQDFPYLHSVGNDCYLAGDHLRRLSNITKMYLVCAKACHLKSCEVKVQGGIFFYRLPPKVTQKLLLPNGLDCPNNVYDVTTLVAPLLPYLHILNYCEVQVSYEIQGEQNEVQVLYEWTNSERTRYTDAVILDVYYSSEMIEEYNEDDVRRREHCPITQDHDRWRISEGLMCVQWCNGPFFGKLQFPTQPVSYCIPIMCEVAWRCEQQKCEELLRINEVN